MTSYYSQINVQQLSMKEEAFLDCYEEINRKTEDEYNEKEIVNLISSLLELKEKFPDKEARIIAILYSILNTKVGHKLLINNKKLAVGVLDKAYELMGKGLYIDYDIEEQDACKVIHKFVMDTSYIYNPQNNKDDEEEEYVEYDDLDENHDIGAIEFDERIRHNNDEDDEEDVYDN